MVPLSMTLIGSLLGFQGHDIFRYSISQKRHEIELFNVVTIEHQ